MVYMFYVVIACCAYHPCCCIHTHLGGNLGHGRCGLRGGGREVQQGLLGHWTEGGSWQCISCRRWWRQGVGVDGGCCRWGGCRTSGSGGGDGPCWGGGGDGGLCGGGGGGGGGGDGCLGDGGGGDGGGGDGLGNGHGRNDRGWWRDDLGGWGWGVDDCLCVQREEVVHSPFCILSPPKRHRTKHAAGAFTQALATGEKTVWKAQFITLGRRFSQTTYDV